jgi:hypothetical protein
MTSGTSSTFVAHFWTLIGHTWTIGLLDNVHAPLHILVHRPHTIAFSFSLFHILGLSYFRNACNATTSSHCMTMDKPRREAPQVIEQSQVSRTRVWRKSCENRVLKYLPNTTSMWQHTHLMPRRKRKAHRQSPNVYCRETRITNTSLVKECHELEQSPTQSSPVRRCLPDEPESKSTRKLLHDIGSGGVPT